MRRERRDRSALSSSERAGLQSVREFSFRAEIGFLSVSVTSPTFSQATTQISSREGFFLGIDSQDKKGKKKRRERLSQYSEWNARLFLGFSGHLGELFSSSFFFYLQTPRFFLGERDI